MALELTRRDLLTSTGTFIAIISGLSRSAVGSISYTIRNTFIVPADGIRHPTEYSYDMVEFQGNGVIEFGENSYVEFGNENYPPNKPGTGIGIDLPTDVTFPSDVSLDMDSNLPTQISLPMSFNLYTMNIGIAITLVGLHGVLLGAAHLFRNYAAGIMWGIALVFLILSGLLDLSLELYWLSIVLTVVLLIAGLVVRWSQ